MPSPPRISTIPGRHTTSEPCSPVDSPPTKHRHTDSDPAFKLSLTPPTVYHSLASSFSFSTGSLNSDRLGSAGGGRGRSLHAPVHISPPPSRDTSVGSQDSTDTHGSWRKYFSPRSWKTTPSKRHAPVPKEQTDAYLRTKMVRFFFNLTSLVLMSRIVSAFTMLSNQSVRLLVPGSNLLQTQGNSFPCLVSQPSPSYSRAFGTR